MPREDHLLNLPEMHVEKITGRNPVHIHARYRGKVCCPRCGATDLRCKDRYERKVRHESIGLRKVWLHLEGHKYYCRGCKRYFRQRFPGILPGRRASEPFRLEVVTDHLDGICQSRAAQRAGIGSATLERWTQDLLERKLAEMRGNPCPRMLGIDEHYFSRRDGYATTFTNLRRNRVFDVVKGRSKKALRSYLRGLKGREKVQVVCMDLSSSYRSIVRKYFPNALIVADRFHVIRLMGYHFDGLWRQLDPNGSRNRGLVSLMRRRPDRLREDQVQRLEDYLRSHPDIHALYDFKQELWKMLSHKALNPPACRKLVPTFLEQIEELKASSFEAMRTLGNTLDDWKDEIARMWRFTKSNGITEGLHNKMELISRRAYGFKNFDNYRLRVRALCS